MSFVLFSWTPTFEKSPIFTVTYNAFCLLSTMFLSRQVSRLAQYSLHACAECYCLAISATSTKQLPRSVIAHVQIVYYTSYAGRRKTDSTKKRIRAITGGVVGDGYCGGIATVATTTSIGSNG